MAVFTQTGISTMKSSITSGSPGSVRESSVALLKYKSWQVCKTACFLVPMHLLFLSSELQRSPILVEAGEPNRA